MKKNNEEDATIKTGADKFLKSSDDLFGRAAEVMDECDLSNPIEIANLREICDIVKITAMSIKSLKEDGNGKEPETPMEKKKRKAGGAQVTV